MIMFNADQNNNKSQFNFSLELQRVTFLRQKAIIKYGVQESGGFKATGKKSSLGFSSLYKYIIDTPRMIRHKRKRFLPVAHFGVFLSIYLFSNWAFYTYETE